MTQARPSLSASTPDNALDTRKPAGADETKTRKRKPRNRKHTRNASAARRIHAKARDRQIAWAENNPTTVEALTGELEREYRALRDGRAGHVVHDFRGRSASYMSPPMPPTPRKWRGEAA